ncbi:MAG TPA: hypothetical protein VIJ71_03170 [Mycobacteriales bacterium]
MTTAIAVVGWAASASLLVGYRLVTTGRLHGASLTYLALNMFGSVGLGLSTAETHSWPSAANNLIWLALGVGPLTRALRSVRARRREPRTETAAGVSA